MLRGVLAAMLVIGMALGATRAGAAEVDPAANVRDFDFLVDKVTRNYAGYDSKVGDANRAALTGLTQRLRGQAAAATDAELAALMRQWTDWFRDGHLGVSPSGGATPAVATPRRPLSETQLRLRLAQLGARCDPVEGIWRIGGDRYRVGVLRRGGAPDRFDAVVLTTTADNWRPGEIKAELRRDGPAYRGVYRAGDHGAAAVNPTITAGGAILALGREWGDWRRELPAIADPDGLDRRYPAGDMALRRLSPVTLWLRMPDFNDGRAKPLLALLETHREALAQTPNLVIDLRGNGGGSDYVYAPLLALVYSRPIVSVGVEMRASPDNLRLRKAVADGIRAEAPGPAAELDAETVRMAAKGEGYFQQNAMPFSIERRDRVLPMPRRVAVLIDGAGSTGEQFLLDSRQSRKVTLFGQRNSAGVLDFANVVGMPTPSGRFRVFWATSRSLRLPADPVDPDGIAPDIRIPATETDPVRYAQGWLERQAAD